MNTRKQTIQIFCRKKFLVHFHFHVKFFVYGGLTQAKAKLLIALNATYEMLHMQGAVYDNFPVETGPGQPPGQHKKIQQKSTVEIGLFELLVANTNMMKR